MNKTRHTNGRRIETVKKIEMAVGLRYSWVYSIIILYVLPLAARKISIYSN